MRNQLWFALFLYFYSFWWKNSSHLQLIIMRFCQFPFRMLIYCSFTELSFCHGLHEWKKGAFLQGSFFWWSFRTDHFVACSWCSCVNIWWFSKRFGTFGTLLSPFSLCLGVNCHENQNSHEKCSTLESDAHLFVVWRLSVVKRSSNCWLSNLWLKKG